MMPRSWTLLLLAYVALEFSNPLMPGAVNFNPDESVEGIHREVNSATRLAPESAQPWLPRQAALTDALRAPARPARRSVAVRLSHASGLRIIDPRSADPPLSSEDH